MNVMRECIWIAFAFLCFSGNGLSAQDTFSIVALDSVTGEVGSAGASCVSLSSFPGFADDFLGELFPGVGAINSQAYYVAGNQANARARMNMGETPAQIIDWLVNNDVGGQPQLRQYGITALVNGSPQSAAHTGTSTDNYKGHITGPNYSIQGNILLGQQILDSMESRFLRAEGDLACRLMAAMQGANVVGADTRCASNGSSSLFAFVKVAQPSDAFGSPSFVLSVRTNNGQGIEPIDSLQTLFDNANNCNLVSREESDAFAARFQVFPNPVTGQLSVQHLGLGGETLSISLMNLTGKSLLEEKFRGATQLNMEKLSAGVYILRIREGAQYFSTRIVKK